MMAAYILNGAGFVIGTFEGAGAPPNSTFLSPPENASQPLRFVDGAWLTDPVPPPSWDEAPAEYWWIDKGPFFDRFGAKALTITSSQDSVVQGLLNLVMVRQYIDLKRADLPPMLGLLVQKGLLNVGEAAAVLSPPTTDYERHIKGLPQPSA